MPQQNNPLVSDSMRQNFFKSFLETYDTCGNCPTKMRVRHSEFIQKRNEFDLKYSVSDTLNLVQQDLGIAMVENLANPSQPSSSFQIFYDIIVGLACQYEQGVVQGVPEVWKSLIHMIPMDERSIITMPPLLSITKEEGPSKASQGSKLTALEIHGGHENQGEENSATIANPTCYSFSSSPSTINNHNDGTNPNLYPVIQHSQVNERHNVTDTNNGSFVIDNMPYSPIAPHEPTKVAFAVLAAIIELVSTLSNFALNDSPRAKDIQPLIYIVLLSSTFAFLLSSTALLLHGKRPATANKRQKVAFLFGAFGFLGIVGMHFPPTVMWGFTISAFLVCSLLFTIATFI